MISPCSRLNYERRTRAKQSAWRPKGRRRHLVHRISVSRMPALCTRQNRATAVLQLAAFINTRC
jgi:hypothetical protein